MLSTSYTITLLLGGLNLGVDTALDRGTLGADSAVNLKHFGPKSQPPYKVQVQNVLNIFILQLYSYCTLPGLSLSICFPVGLEPAFILLLTQVSLSKLHFETTGIFVDKVKRKMAVKLFFLASEAL